MQHTESVAHSQRDQASPANVNKTHCQLMWSSWYRYATRTLLSLVAIKSDLRIALISDLSRKNSQRSPQLKCRVFMWRPDDVIVNKSGPAGSAPHCIRGVFLIWSDWKRSWARSRHRSPTIPLLSPGNSKRNWTNIRCSWAACSLHRNSVINACVDVAVVSVDCSVYMHVASNPDLSRRAARQIRNRNSGFKAIKVEATVYGPSQAHERGVVGGVCPYQLGLQIQNVVCLAIVCACISSKNATAWRISCAPRYKPDFLFASYSC